jgi:hypothetical protein
MDEALELFKYCGMEWNAKTKQFLAKKERLQNAGAGQALIHLHDHYCSGNKCLNCALGVSLLKKEPCLPGENFLSAQTTSIL